MWQQVRFVKLINEKSNFRKRLQKKKKRWLASLVVQQNRLNVTIHREDCRLGK